MVDNTSRNMLLEAIVLLVSKKITWREFDSICGSIITQDDAVIEIKWAFWVSFDPEYPSNKNGICYDDVLRSIVFLLSNCEYAKSASSTKTWPFNDFTIYESELIKYGDLAKTKLRMASIDEKYVASQYNNIDDS